MQPFKSVADFKRAMVKGSIWHTTHQYLKPNASVTDMGIRTCVISQSNSFALQAPDKDRPSWCDWPKASEFSSPASGVGVITKPNFVQLTYTLKE